ncbi:Multimodular transpeptidase-transglycosylase [hydrothermal vent metagenome]|uniref:peptidoglycan glycosyltransferase n=1 Tax=hydrothermal vent metagenome TaxID=652676 RepID=A0A1W1B9W8_9ZZZZ
MKIIKNIILTLLITIFLFWLFNFLYPLDIHRLQKPKSTLIYDKNHQLLCVKLSSDGYLRIPIKEEEISQNIKQIVLGYEDQYFEKHFGVNPLAIIRALWFNLTNQHKIGASTITMQVARMMHHKSRTIGQKLKEIFQALQLELNYSKDEILTLYLNNAPYGGNVEGFASASFRYFNLPPSSLSISQIAYLTSIPKNPNRNRPKTDRDINSIKNRLLKRLYGLELIEKKSYQQAKDEKISTNIKNLPNRVPHLTNYIKDSGEIQTTIDITLQNRVQRVITSQIKTLKNFGIHNGSAIVIDNKTMQILAYVGSQDFYDNQYGGQNDGLNSLISPGSTLKPLIYAKALEQGIITPLKKLYDVPLFIDGYKPTNYSKLYLGEVTATKALQYSLNIPAVELDRLLKDKSLYTLLKKLNISSLNKSKNYYGSALALGGWGLRLRKNAELFAMLANGGVFQPSSYLQNSNSSKIEVLTPQSTYLISNILADAPRTEFSSSWEFIKDMPKVAFKTGTSAHAKDMLTIGYTPQYTVGVWYGNFSGKASKIYNNHYATGLQSASPTLFKIFKLLGKQSWFKRPKNIIRQPICQDAIQIDKCKKRVTDYVIKDIKLKTPCSAMRGEVLSYLIQNRTIDSIAQLSKHHCYERWREYKPLITNPIHNKIYTHNRLLPNELKKTMLQCYSFDSNSTIYWLIDKEPPIVSKSGEKIYRYLTPNKHTITCLDEGAKIQSVVVEMKEI